MPVPGRARWDEQRQRWRRSVRWRDATGRRRTEERFGDDPDKLDAWAETRWAEIREDREAARVRRRLVEAGFALPSPQPILTPAPGPRPTLTSFVEDFLRWLPLSKAAPGTVRSYGIELHKTILPLLGALPLDEITPTRVDYLRTYLERKGRVVAPPLTALSALCNHAVREGLLERNPCHRPRGLYRADLAEPKTSKTRTLTREQRQAVLDGLPAPTTRHLRCTRWTLRLAGWCGLRLGELRGLRPEDVDLEIGVLHVERQELVLSGKGLRLIRAPKYLSRRTVPLGQQVWSELGEAVREAERLGLPVLLARPRTRQAPTWASGKGVKRHVAEAQEKLGIEPLPWRWWRATFATLALEHYPAHWVEQWLGHRGLATGLTRVGREHYVGGWDLGEIDRRWLD